MVTEEPAPQHGLSGSHRGLGHWRTKLEQRVRRAKQPEAGPARGLSPARAAAHNASRPLLNLTDELLDQIIAHVPLGFHYNLALTCRKLQNITLDPVRVFKRSMSLTSVSIRRNPKPLTVQQLSEERRELRQILAVEAQFHARGAQGVCKLVFPKGRRRAPKAPVTNLDFFPLGTRVWAQTLDGRLWAWNLTGRSNKARELVTAAGEQPLAANTIYPSLPAACSSEYTLALFASDTEMLFWDLRREVDAHGRLRAISLPAHPPGQGPQRLGIFAPKRHVELNGEHVATTEPLSDRIRVARTDGVGQPLDLQLPDGVHALSVHFNDTCVVARTDAGVLVYRHEADARPTPLTRDGKAIFARETLLADESQQALLIERDSLSLWDLAGNLMAPLATQSLGDVRPMRVKFIGQSNRVLYVDSWDGTPHIWDPATRTVLMPHAPSEGEETHRTDVIEPTSSCTSGAGGRGARQTPGRCTGTASRMPARSPACHCPLLLLAAVGVSSPTSTGAMLGPSRSGAMPFP
jgi:hypothetical protein